MGVLRTTVPTNLLKGVLIALLVLLVIGLFFPREEVFWWHMTSSDKVWSCQKFDVTAAESWIADSGSSCVTGIHLVKPRSTLVGSLQERGSVTFLEQKQITDNSFLVKFEQAFRLVTGKPPNAVLTYTDQYQQPLGKCAVEMVKDRHSIILWCQNPQSQLVTRYDGEETSLPEILEMLKQR